MINVSGDRDENNAGRTAYEIVDVSHGIKFRQGLAGDGVYRLEAEIPAELSIWGEWKVEWNYEYKKARGEEAFHLKEADIPAEFGEPIKRLGGSKNTWALLKDARQLNTVFFIPDHEDPAPKVVCALTYKDDEKEWSKMIIGNFPHLVAAQKKSTPAKELQTLFGWTEDFAQKVIKGNDLKAGTVFHLPPAGLDKPPTTVRMSRASAKPTDDIGLWMMIRASSDSLSWEKYKEAMDLVLSCGKVSKDYDSKVMSLASRRTLPFTDTDSYRALKVATEAFLLANTPTVIDAKQFDYLERRDFNIQEARNAVISYQQKNKVIPYLQRVVENLKGTVVGAEASKKLEAFRLSEDDGCGCEDIGCFEEDEKLSQPLLIELIWSYWLEEASLVQSMHAISRRFQNMRSNGAHDPLAQLDLDSLRPLNNLLWGYTRDAQHRLTLAQRAYEYSHLYGISLIGKAVPQLRPADNRSKFIEAFHNLLSLCAQFYSRADDTTVVADGFPVLNALREVHLLLSEGAGNQFRDLPATARVEMLMEQWMLARPEFREFLPRRASIAYPEDWMHSVDSMRRLQGWGDTNVLHFWHLATCGERVVSSIRWGNWNEVLEPENASNWANFFRPDIQSYIHAYRAVTGVDITLEPVDSTMPSVHLQRRQAAGMLKRA